MPWDYDNEEINGIVDTNLKDSPPNPPAVNTAATVRTLLKSFWTAISGQVASAIQYVDETNSDVFIQESIAQAQAFADTAEGNLTAMEGLLSLTQAEKDTVLQAKLDVVAYAATFQTLIAAGFNPKGNWNVSTNTPNLSSISKVAGDAYVVTVGGDTSLTGVSITAVKGDVFHWNGANWIYRPNVAPPDGSVSEEKLTPWLNNLFQQLPPESPYLWVVTDENRRKGFAIRKDGKIEGNFIIKSVDNNAIGTDALQNESVSLDKLKPEVKTLFETPFDADNTKYLYVIQDQNGRIALAIDKEGYLIGKYKLANGSIGQQQLSSDITNRLLTDALLRLNNQNPNDVAIEDDGLWRSQELDLSVKTDLSGICFSKFPNFKTPVLKGTNSTVESIEIRKSNNVPLRGRRYRGTFSPSALIVGTNFRGNYGNSSSDSYPAFPAGSTGDCWVIDCGNATGTKTANGLTFKNGDYLVKTASGYDIQAGPGDGTFREGDFWNITTNGTFGGMAVSDTGRLVCLGFQSASGPKYVKYVASKPGEFYLMGEADATAFAPGTYRNGDIYIISVAGTAQGYTVAIGDSIFYQDGWGKLSGELKTILSGQAFYYACQNASEYEVRRSSKSTTAIAITAQGYGASVQRKSKDNLLLLSDSMFGVSSVGNNILTASGRTGTVLSYGGGTSEDVLAMLRYHIRNGDPYAGYIHVFWHGQNNNTDVTQVKKVAHEMAALVGASEKRFAFWSVIGPRTASYSGGRIVIAPQEGAKTGTNNIAQIEQFYSAAYPKQFFSPRLALLESASETLPDLQNPGMTLKQSADTYGIVPLNFFLDYNALPVAASSWNFLGYRSGTDLPTGGANGDYYIQTNSGAIGTFSLNVAGVWQSISFDTVHMRPDGAAALAQKFTTYLTTKAI